MSELAKRHCVPCEGKTKPLTKEAAEKLLAELGGGWQLIGDKEIAKEFVFRGFSEAIKFINELAAIAESEDHHPDINLHGWNKVKITLSTHAIGGLSDNDFILAAKINQLIKSY